MSKLEEMMSYQKETLAYLEDKLSETDNPYMKAFFEGAIDEAKGNIFMINVLLKGMEVVNV